MSKKTTRQTGNFIAKDDDGNEYEILVFTDFHHTLGKEIEGNKSLETVTGENVNWIADGRYEIVLPDGNLKLTSDDPNRS